MKVYLSSTMQDLRECRSAVDRVLRQMGHDVIGMEQYVAEATTPVQKVQSDVRSAGVYVVIVAWRYGYVPADDSDGKSITELELEAAKNADPPVPVLAFLLDPEAPWPPRHLDALSPGGDAPIRRLRSELGKSYLAGIFSTPDQLASQVAAAVARQGITAKMVERQLTMTTISDSMRAFVRGDLPTDNNPTAIDSIQRMVSEAGAGTVRSLRVDLGRGETWWSTRLFLLAVLVRTLTDVRQFVFARSDGSFAGMASPTAVRDALSKTSPVLAAMEASLRSGDASQDVSRELRRTLDVWGSTVRPQEEALQVGVRVPLLTEWLGERLVTRCIRVDPESGLTMIQVQQIVDSLLPAVPIERPVLEPSASGSRKVTDYELMVVDRDAFALELARQWVSSSLPRAPIL